MMNHHGTRMLHGPVTHPQSMGMSERVVQLVKAQMMRWAIERNRQGVPVWHLNLHKFVNNINARYVRELGMSPSQALLGFQPMVHGAPIMQDDPDAFDGTEEDVLMLGNLGWNHSESVMRSWELRQEWMESHNLQKVEMLDEDNEGKISKRPEYVEGDLIWEKADKAHSSHSKFAAGWDGPKMILGKASDVSWFIRDLSGKDRVRKIHQSHLKRYIVRRQVWGPE